VDASERNLCRDVTAERLRRVMGGFAGRTPLNGDFAYLELDKLDPADARLDATVDHAHLLLMLRMTQCAGPLPDGPAKIVAASDELAIVYLPEVTPEALSALLALPQPRLAVYSPRPQTVAERLEHSGKQGNCYSIGDAIMLGQGGAR